MIENIYQAYSKKDDYSRLTINEFLNEIKKKFHAIEINQNEPYIKKLCAKIQNPIILEIKDDEILCDLFTNEEKQTNRKEAILNVNNKQLETYYDIMIGKVLIILIENLGENYNYSIRVIGNSVRLLNELIILKGISLNDAITMNSKYKSYISAKITCGYISKDEYRIG